MGGIRNRSYTRYNVCESREQSRKMARVALYMTWPGPWKPEVCIELHRSPSQALGDMPATGCQSQTGRTGGWPGLQKLDLAWRDPGQSSGNKPCHRPGWHVPSSDASNMPYRSELMIWRFRGLWADPNPGSGRPRTSISKES